MRARKMETDVVLVSGYSLASFNLQSTSSIDIIIIIAQFSYSRDT
jgi:hypothetical protein